MRFPWRLNYDLTKYIIKNNLGKVEKYPLVLMLEPTHLCNLTCSGCGRIREYADTINDMMSLEDCLKSVDECPAPVVTITGGEPFLYPHIFELTQGILDRGRHIMFCTNAVLMEQSLDKMQPHPNLTFNVHMDGLEQTHDRILERKGCFKTGMAAIKAAKAKGFRVCTNTTIFTNTDLIEKDMLFSKQEAGYQTAHTSCVLLSACCKVYHCNSLLCLLRLPLGPSAPSRLWLPCSLQPAAAAPPAGWPASAASADLPHLSRGQHRVKTCSAGRCSSHPAGTVHP